MLRPMHKRNEDSQLPRRVSLFRNGRNQAVRIPRDLELEGDEALIRREGDALIIEPVRRGRLLQAISRWEALEDEFPDVDGDLEPLDEPDL